MKYKIKTVLVFVSMFILHNLRAAIVKIVNNAPYPIVAHVGQQGGLSREKLFFRTYVAISSIGLSEIGRKSGNYLLEPKQSIKYNTGLEQVRVAFSKPEGKKLYVVNPGIDPFNLNATIMVNSLSDIRRGKKTLEIKVVEIEQ